MSKKMIAAMESTLADKMRDKGRPEKGKESAEYGPAAFMKKKKRGRK